MCFPPFFPALTFFLFFLFGLFSPLGTFFLFQLGLPHDGQGEQNILKRTLIVMYPRSEEMDKWLMHRALVLKVRGSNPAMIW